VEVVAESSDSITNPEVFDVFRSVLKYSSSVPGSVMNKVLDSISSGLQGELEGTIRDVESGDQAAYMAHKLPLELYAFLLQWFVTAAERVKAQDEDGPAVPVPAPIATGKGRKGRGRSGKTGSRVTGGATSGSSAAKAKASVAAFRGEERWTWEEQIPPTLGLISRILVKLQTQRIWTTSAEREAFVR
jgi:condensin complex subunit 1